MRTLKVERTTSNIEHLVHTREQLIAAHRWCESQPGGQKTRRGLIAAALRRMEKPEARGQRPEARKKKTIDHSMGRLAGDREGRHSLRDEH